MAARESIAFPRNRTTTPTPAAACTDLSSRTTANVYENQLFGWCSNRCSPSWACPSLPARLVHCRFHLRARQSSGSPHRWAGVECTVSPCAPWAPRYASISWVAAGQGKDAQSVVSLAFKRRPIGAIVATISITVSFHPQHSESWYFVPHLLGGRPWAPSSSWAAEGRCRVARPMIFVGPT